MTSEPEILHQVPPWDQLNDPLPDGRQDPYASSDCGFECAAMVKYATDAARPSFPAGALRQLLGGWQRPGLTSADDVAAVLHKLDVPAHARSANLQQLQVEIGHAIAAREPAIVLGHWDGYPLHWVVFIGDDGQAVIVRDPWPWNGDPNATQGQTYTLAWSRVGQLYAASYVHVDIPVV